MTHPSATIEQRLQEIEAQLDALAIEKEQLLEAQTSQDKERLNHLSEKVKAACDDDEMLLGKVLAFMGYEPTSRKRHLDLEQSAQQLRRT
ncbi:MAG: hypothetical protein ACFBSF_15300 [Leptolyngbyaceae cyanobacterium]